VFPTLVYFQENQLKPGEFITAQQVTGAYYCTMILDTDGRMLGSSCNYQKSLGDNIPDKIVNIGFNSTFLER